MPHFTFLCSSKRHEHASTRQFVTVINCVADKRVDQFKCPECGGLAKRDLVADLQTVSTVGSTPISHASTINGTLAHATQFAFGRFKENPDGSVDRNHTRFSTTGELERFVNGRNELGVPRVDDNGNPIRRPDGSLIRQGAKFVKFSNQKRPPINKKPRYVAPGFGGWVGNDDIQKVGPTPRNLQMDVPRYSSPQRGK